MARPREFDEDHVVAQAMELFWEKGYRRTTPRELMEATGLSKSSLYATFGSKQGLFLRALALYSDGQVHGMREMLASGDLRTVLTTMYESVARSCAVEAGGVSCLMCTTSIETTAEDVAINQQLAEGRAEWQAVFAERLERAQREGEIEAHRDPKALARFLYSNNMGLMVLARSGASADELRQVAREIVDAVCR